MKPDDPRRSESPLGRGRALPWPLAGLVALLVLAGLALWWWQQPENSAEDGPGGTKPGGQVAGTASVIDGDTLDIRGTRIRLFGVDAPESTQTCRRGQQEYACGREAAQALSKFLEQNTVVCQRRDTDRYGRMVAVCHAGNVDVNGWLVENGYALAYRQYSTDYVNAENAARKARKGIHAGTFVNPSDYRKGETKPAPASPTRQPYNSCAEARSKGKTPVLRGEPGYNPRLDGDRDGKMCE